MKVYDGAGLIAEKSGALVVPVRIDGLERTPFSRLSRAQIRRKWWPKVIVTVLEPVKIDVAPHLFGRKRRQAAGAALYAVMSDLVFRTTSTDRTVFEALIEAGGQARLAPCLHRGCARRTPHLFAADHGRDRSWAVSSLPLAEPGKPLGVMLPNAIGSALHGVSR